MREWAEGVQEPPIVSEPLPNDPDEVRTIALALLGQAPTAVDRVPSFAANRVFRVRVGSASHFFKFGSASDIDREAVALAPVEAIGPGVKRRSSISTKAPRSTGTRSRRPQRLSSPGHSP